MVRFENQAFVRVYELILEANFASKKE